MRRPWVSSFLWREENRRRKCAEKSRDMMGSFRRPRPRFMSSPVLSDLTRFQASTPGPQISNTIVWNRLTWIKRTMDGTLVTFAFTRVLWFLSVQSAVLKVFQGRVLQTNELYTLNESIRWLLKTEMGSFITVYFQNQLLTRGLSGVLEQILLHRKDTGDNQLTMLTDLWNQFFTQTLPTLQAIFYPVQGQELTVRQMALLAFRDLVLLKLHLEETLGTAGSLPPAFTQMLLVLQGVHESSGPSLEYYRLERLVEIVVSPYICNVMHSRNNLLPGQQRPSALLLGNYSHPEITITQHQNSFDSSSLSPLVEKEGEVYLQKTGGVRRHTVANAHSDVRLLLVSNRMHAGMGRVGPVSPRTSSNRAHMLSTNESRDDRSRTCDATQGGKTQKETKTRHCMN